MAATASEPRGRVALPVAFVAALVLCCLQAPGRIAPETKLDLAIDPSGFLGRALHLWDARAGFGQLQNQAVGYLFPMGPFFASGKALHVPMWVVQRAWMATLLVCAFWGTVRLATAMGIGAPSGRIVAAAGYALSPPMVTLVGFTSGGQLGAALAPWALVPLVRAARGGSVRRAAARSGLAVTAMGAVNAASTVLVLPLPALWILTRARGARRRAFARWWVLAVGLGCLWWVVPLLLQGRYGFNFVPFTESVRVTTATHSLAQVLRGTGYWLSSLFVNGPWVRAGWDMEHIPLAIIGSGLLAAIGMYGLARRDMPERRFLVGSVALAVLVLGSSYSGALGGPLAGPVRSLLEGPLAALRNLDKIEPVLRLPLALGVAHALSTFRLARVDRLTAAGVVALLVLVGAAPFIQGDGVADGSFTRIPAYWQASARWLAGHGGTARTLVLPAEAFGDYSWGRTLDEPLAPLARSPWAVRNLVPLGTPDLTHLLDAIEQRIDTARPSPGLAAELARVGVRYVLLRNDLDRGRATAPPATQLERAIGQLPGVRLVRSFGPEVDGGLTADRLLPGLRAPRRVRALRIYEVEGTEPRATAYPDAATVTALGGSDAVLQLADRGQLAGRAVILGGDAAKAAPGGVVVSDGLQLRDVFFGSVRNNASYVLATGERAPGTARPPADWVDRSDDRTRAVTQGATSADASSYASFFARLPEYQPANAFDGDPSTAWAAGSPVTSAGDWAEIRLTRRVTASSIVVRLLHDHEWRPWITAVRLTTDGGSVTRELRKTEAPQTLLLPNGSTRNLRVTIVAVAGGAGAAGAGIRDVELPGVRVARPLQVPAAPSATGDVTLLFDRSTADPYDATRADEETRMLRRFSLGAGETVGVTGTAVPTPGEKLDAVLQPPSGPGLHVTASSTWESLPGFGPANLVDGDQSTVWLAGPEDPHPVVTLTWAQPRMLDEVVLGAAPVPSLKPARLRLVSPAGERDVEVAGHGPVHFDPLTTDQLTVQFAESSGSGGAGLLIPPPVGLSDLRFPALDDLRPARADDGSAFEIPCGSGPPITIDGQARPTALSGTFGDVRSLRPLQLTACDGTVALDAGAHALSSDDTGAFRVTTLTLAASTPAAPMRSRAVRIGVWGAEHRVLHIGRGLPAVLATTENYNAGWTARLGGRALQPVRVDGWRQGWRVPAGQGGVVDLEFGPGRAYRFALGVGAIGVLMLVALAVACHRRPDPDPVAAAEAPGWIQAAGITAVAFLVAGPFGAAVALAVLRIRPRQLAGIAGLAFAAATAIVALQPGRFPSQHAGAFGPVAQALSAVAVVALLASLLDPRPAPMPLDRG